MNKNNLLTLIIIYIYIYIFFFSVVSIIFHVNFYYNNNNYYYYILKIFHFSGEVANEQFTAA